LFANHPNSIVDDEFLADERKIVPGLGEMGQPVSLSGEEADLAAELMKKEAFNIIASDKVTKNGLQKNNKNNSLNLLASGNGKYKTIVNHLCTRVTRQHFSSHYFQKK
jgi:hypothetical protein